MNPPTGTVTLVFTDIQGSSEAWERHRDTFMPVLEAHNLLMREFAARWNGYEVKTEGDAFFLSFAKATDAIHFCVDAQLAIWEHSWVSLHPEVKELRVRMGVHTGQPIIGMHPDGTPDYFGHVVNRAARIGGAGHGGQIILSDATHALVCDELPAEIKFLELGKHNLKGVGIWRLWQVCHPQLCHEFPQLKFFASILNNLPLQLTSFIGREKEISDAVALLEKTRLLTFTGSGGCGKTRLALHVAADVLEQFPDGVRLVELAQLIDPALVPQVVASVLDLSEQAGKTYTQVITEHLKTRKMLLILDNCEHLVAACASFAVDLLHSCPDVHILTSSRGPLNITGEQTFRVPCLSLPNPRKTHTATSLLQHEAVRLFIERARTVQPSFAVTNTNASAVTQVCCQLDGIPLAIELAAARVRSLSVEEVNTKLDNCFRLLTGGARTTLPRHQTLQATIDWSYDLLDAQEKLFLAQLSVFAGGWTLAAAEHIGAGVVGWEVLDLTTSLVDKCLVLADTHGETTRYRLLETMRQYAVDRLIENGARDLIRTKHRDYFLALAETANAHLVGSEQAYWLGVLEEEHNNLREALMFCLEAPAGFEMGLRLGNVLSEFWIIRGYLSEGRERLIALLTRSETQKHASAYAYALNHAGKLARMQGDWVSARSLHEQSLKIFRREKEKVGIADVLNNIGAVEFDLCNYTQAYSRYEKSLAIYRKLLNERGIATVLGNLGNIALYESKYALARSRYEEALKIFQVLGDGRKSALTLNNLGTVATDQGDYALAHSHYEEALKIYWELGDRQGHARTLSNLGIVALGQGNYTQAHDLYKESLKLYRDIEDKQGIAISLDNLGNVALKQGDFVSARLLCQESLDIYLNLEDKEGIADARESLGNVALCQDDDTFARSLFRESIVIRQELEDKNGIAVSLEAFANLAVKEQAWKCAVRLFGAAEMLRQSINVLRHSNEQEKYNHQISHVRTKLDEAAFAVAWEEGGAMSLAQAVEHALQELPQ